MGEGRKRGRGGGKKPAEPTFLNGRGEERTEKANTSFRQGEGKKKEKRPRADRFLRWIRPRKKEKRKRKTGTGQKKKRRKGKKKKRKSVHTLKPLQDRYEGEGGIQKKRLDKT